jgi:mannose-1-phosphate guanylyltransferase
VNAWAVILAGGVGSRFWPLSTPERPKQLLPLVTDQPLLVDSVRRLTPVVPPAKTLILTNAALTEAVCKTVSSIPPENVIAEPRPAGTAAALTWAASEIARRGSSDAVMICIHADWAIAAEEQFRDTLLSAARVAVEERALVTVGVRPTRADPGFGYIHPGSRTESGAFSVTRFVEKPTRERAEWMRHEGYLWNSGIFVWRVDDLLEGIRQHTPEVASALGQYGGTNGDRDAFFSTVTPISIDVGLMERSKKVLVVPGDFGWDDVGTWAALRRVRPADNHGNVVAGDVHAVDASGNVVHSTDQTVVLYGVRDLVVVCKDGLTVVTTIDKAADLKRLTEALPKSLVDRS